MHVVTELWCHHWSMCVCMCACLNTIYSLEHTGSVVCLSPQTIMVAHGISSIREPQYHHWSIQCALSICPSWLQKGCMVCMNRSNVQKRYILSMVHGSSAGESGVKVRMSHDGQCGACRVHGGQVCKVSAQVLNCAHKSRGHNLEHVDLRCTSVTCHHLRNAIMV